MDGSFVYSLFCTVLIYDCVWSDGNTESSLSTYVSVRNFAFCTNVPVSTRHPHLTQEEHGHEFLELCQQHKSINVLSKKLKCSCYLIPNGNKGSSNSESHRLKPWIESSTFVIFSAVIIAWKIWKSGQIDLCPFIWYAFTYNFSLAFINILNI